MDTMPTPYAVIYPNGGFRVCRSRRDAMDVAYRLHLKGIYAEVRPVQ